MNRVLKQSVEEDSGSDWDSIVEPSINLKESLSTTKNVPESLVTKKNDVGRKTSFKKSERDSQPGALQFSDHNHKELLPPFNFKGVISDDETEPSSKPVPPPGKPKKHQYNPSFVSVRSPNKESSGNAVLGYEESTSHKEQVNIAFDNDNDDSGHEDPGNLNKSHSATKSSFSSSFSKHKEGSGQKSWKQDVDKKKSDQHRSSEESSNNKKKLRFAKMKNTEATESTDSHGISKQKIQERASGGTDTSSNLKDSLYESKEFSFNWMAKDVSCPHLRDTPGRWHYPFNHGSYECFHITMDNEGSCVDPMADKYSRNLKRIYMEIFNGIGIVFDSFTLFLLQLLRFVLASIVHPLTIGIFLTVCDFLLKPALAALFNGLLQPLLIFLWNILISFARLLEPFLSIVAQLCHLTADLCKSVRILEINHYHQFPPPAKTETV